MTDIQNIENILHSLKEETSAAPSDTFRTNARIRIINTVTNPHPLRPSWYQRPRVMGYTFGTALATVVLSVGTVYAAQSSLPNSKLYPIKVLSEQVALTLSPTESLKTTVAQTIISRRITEVEQLQKHGDTHAVEESITHLNEDVASIKKRKDVSRRGIEQTLTEHKDFMNSINRDHEVETEQENKKEQPSEQSLTGTPAVNVTPKDNLSPTPASSDSSQGGSTTTQTEIKLPSVEGTTTTHEDN